MQKYGDGEIKPFKFDEINSSHVVSPGKFEDFNFQTIEGNPFNAEKVSQDTIRKERAFAQKNSFKIDGVVADSRGLSRQEKSDLEEKINAEVQKRLEVAFQEAYAEGLSKGREEGKTESMKQMEVVLEQKVAELDQIIISVQAQSSGVIEKNQREVYEFIKRFTKWIVLKEINEKLYLESLLEKLILELNARKNLIIKVGQANFAQMPEVVKVVEAKLGQLSNVRIEIVPEILHPGIILESENGLIDGSIEGVFQNIDKVFELVVPSE